MVTLNDFETIVFCICLRVSPSLSSKRSLIDKSTSRDRHPPRTSIVMKFCLTQYPRHCSLSSHLIGPYFLVFSSSFCVQLSIHGQLISTAMTFFSLRLMNLAFTLFCGRCSCSANAGTSCKDFGSTCKYH